MTSLRPQLESFLQAAFPGAPVTPISGDASSRSFFRVARARHDPLVVMDYGAPFRGETDDVRLSRIFRRAGLPVAQIRRVVPDPGCLLLEDLGDRTFQAALEEIQATSPTTAERDSGVRALYRDAVRLAVDVAIRGTPSLERSDRAAGPALDSERFRFEMDFFLEHFVRDFQGIAEPAAEFRESLVRLADSAAGSGRSVFCHRDFHSRNLMVRADGSLVMVDIQDARWGPDTYDLASLLHDPYVDLCDPFADDLADLYRVSLPSPPSRDEFQARLDLVASQRLVKALGTYGYQTARLRRTRYVPAIARALSQLAIVLPRHPETRGLGDWFDTLGLFRSV